MPILECPRHHKLPRRVPNRGRCTPDECCGATEGAHGAVRGAHAMGQVRGQDNKAAPYVKAYAEETERLLDAKGRMAVWDAEHPLPKVATAPHIAKGMSMFQYARERLAQAVPLAVERLVRKALLTPGPAGDAAADNILDRFGLTRRGEQPVEFNGPVNIVNLMPERIPLLSQKPIEHVAPPRITTGETDGRVEEDVSGQARAAPRVVDREADDADGA